MILPGADGSQDVLWISLAIACCALQVSGPERDLHSGNDGGVFNEPMADLVQLLGSLHGPGGRISVPGFNNNVRPQLMDLAWQGLEASEEFSMSSYRCVW